MQDFKLSAWDLNTNVLLTELRWTGDAIFNDRINDAGEFSVQLPLVDPGAKEMTAVILALGDIPFKLILTANDNTVVLYAGIAWKPSLAKVSSNLTVNGKGLPDYFRMVTMANDYITTINPVTLLQNVVADVQAQPGYNIGVTTRTQVAATPLSITPNYPKVQRGTVAQALSDTTAAITAGTGGVDFYMEHKMTNGVPTHTMVIAAPRAGQSAATSKLHIDLATATDFTRDTDNTASGNHLFVVGQGSGGVQPIIETYAQFPVGGKGQPPRLEQVLQFSHIADINHLRNLGNGMIQMYGRPVTVMTVEIPADYESVPLGSFIAGDDVRIWSQAGILPQFPAGLNEWWRIISYQLKISEDGNASVILTLNRPPSF